MSLTQPQLNIESSANENNITQSSPADSKVLLRVIETMSLEMNFEKMCRYATQITMEVLGANLSALALPGPDGSLLFRYFAGFPPEVEICLPPITPGTLAAFKSGKPVFVQDYVNYAGALKEYLEAGVKSGFAAPIRLGETVTGVLTLAWRKQVDKPLEEHIELVEAVLRQVGFACQRDQLLSELSYSRAEAIALHNRLQRVLSVSPVVVYNMAYDRNGPTDTRLSTVYLSDNIQEMLGYPKEWLSENPNHWYEIIHPDDLQATLLQNHPEAFETGSLDRVYRVRHQNNSYIWIHDSLRIFRGDDQLLDIVGALLDITERKSSEAELRRHRDHLQDLVKEQTLDLIAAKESAEKAMQEAKQAEQQTRYLAFNDPLTALPNRALLLERLNQAIASSKLTGNQFALLFIDLDRFKNINDSLGHFVGDKLLKQVAKRLMTCVRQTDTVSRQGGDEFVILLPEIGSSTNAVEIAKKLVAIVKDPYIVDGYELSVTHSIGITIFPDDADDIEGIMRKADTAMYKAKESGRNNYQFYTKDMSAASIQRMSLEQDLRRALDNEEFVLYYQPQINLSTGKILGIEALARWQHPEHGLLYPEKFIGIAEECGFIVPFGKWVLQKACLQSRMWLDEGINPISMSVNLSAVQLRRKDFLEDVKTIIQKCDMNPQYLNFELTESVLMNGADLTLSLLHSLKSIGITLSIDDFGTDYSSLSYLKRFPVDILKIDRTFISDITIDQDDEAITSAIISMGRSLRLKTIAEGVETKEQLSFLQALHCDEAQGNLFIEPLPANDIHQYLKVGYVNV